MKRKQIYNIISLVLFVLFFFIIYSPIQYMRFFYLIYIFYFLFFVFLIINSFLIITILQKEDNFNTFLELLQLILPTQFLWFIFILIIYTSEYSNIEVNMKFIIISGIIYTLLLLGCFHPHLMRKLKWK